MSKKILIIEDDEAISEYAALVLQKEGFEIRQALDGRVGLEMARSFLPDLVVLDLMMPGMHGYQVCQHLRADDRFAGLKVLITSTKSYDADIQGAQGAGADAYMTKPYAGPALVEKVRALLAECSAAEVQRGDKTPQEKEVHMPSPEQAQNIKTSHGDENGILVRFWGTRGSTPAPGPFTMRYGGNTSCTEMRFGDKIFIIDCGTGLRELGISLLEEYQEKPMKGHIFVGHTHWDHIQGFPFFTPLYLPKNDFQLYSVRGAGKSLERVFRGQMAADYFPVPLRSLSSQLQFVELEEAINIEDVHVKYHHLNHPGVAIGFRFEYGGKSVTYISDHETFSRLSGESEMTLKQDRAIAEFARDSDLLICEAQYDEEEYKVKKGWGHSTFNDVIDRAIESGSKNLVLFHHDPVHTDDMMDRYVEECRQRIKRAGSDLTCCAAQEKQTIRV